MNCWKSINIHRDYGTLRLTLLSILIMLLYFIIFYLSFSSFHFEQKMNEVGLLPFFLGLFLILPLHQLMHIMPLWLTRTKVIFSFTSIIKGIPFPTFCVEEKLPKQLTICSKLMPFITLTFTAIIGSFVFPHFFHYFAIFSAINIGFSVLDLLFVNQIVRAPRQAIIENSDVGIDILINNN